MEVVSRKSLLDFVVRLLAIFENLLAAIAITLFVHILVDRVDDFLSVELTANQKECAQSTRENKTQAESAETEKRF